MSVASSCGSLLTFNTTFRPLHRLYHIPSFFIRRMSRGRISQLLIAKLKLYYLICEFMVEKLFLKLIKNLIKNCSLRSQSPNLIEFVR